MGPIREGSPPATRARRVVHTPGCSHPRLLEVAAEADGPLTERLGQPEAYAAELRASAAALAATHNDNEFLEPEQLVDRDANPVGNRYPQRQQQLGQGTGERSPAPPAPEFRPPPGPVRTP